MFIELTDHLRCPEAHDEAFLVLLPELTVARGVERGTLGCPVCGREYPVVRGVADLGPAPCVAVPAEGLAAEAVPALLGIDGPGGYVVFVGGAGTLAAAGDEALAGIGAVLVNPPPGVSDAPPRVSVLTAPRIPLKSRSVRGAVLGRDYAADAAWVAEARRILLPGRRLVGEGAEPPTGVELLASAGGWWVGV